MKVEVLVSYRLVVDTKMSRATAHDRLLWEGERRAKLRLPTGAYDVRVQGLYSPPVTACASRVRHAQ